MKHFCIVAAILIPVSVAYLKVPTTYFCSYDDFIELHRAAFEDTADPTRIVTSPHFNSSLKYRPLNRAANFVTYQLGDLDPVFYRTRNVAFHLINVVLVYVLAWGLFGRTAISAVAALLFGLHPMANQTIIGAVHTNAMAHAVFLGALLMLMRAVKGGQRWSLWVMASVVSAWLGVMTYDSTIAVFGVMALWLFLSRDTWTARCGSRRFLVSFFVLAGGSLAIYFFLRQLYAPGGVAAAGARLPAVGKILANFVMYAGSLLLPVDVVLANSWLGAPLPSEIEFNFATIAAVTVLSLMGGGVAILVFRRLKARGTEINYTAVIFLVIGAIMSLLPVLLFQSRPSETYLYLPVAFYSILVTYGLAQVFAGESRFKMLHISTVAVLAALFASGTWVRNDRVFSCGETVRRILQGLPDELRQGRQWRVLFANIPGEKSTRPYGFYGFQGIDTIGPSGITPALQLIYRNPLLSGEIVKAEQLIGRCIPGRQTEEVCILVHSDGRLQRLPATMAGGLPPFPETARY